MCVLKQIQIYMFLELYKTTIQCKQNKMYWRREMEIVQKRMITNINDFSIFESFWTMYCWNVLRCVCDVLYMRYTNKCLKYIYR